MTPQLQHAIRLLQLSTIELQAELRDALETNPFLESEEELNGDAQADSSESRERNENGSGEAEDKSRTESSDDASDNEDAVTVADDASDWEPAYDTGPSERSVSRERDDRVLEIRDDSDESLKDYLLWQLNLTHLSETDAAIASSIIEAVNDDGYLTESLEDLLESLMPEHEVELDEVEAMLHFVQHLDPLGVAARDLRECLMLQLSALTDDDPTVLVARLLVANELDTLARGDNQRLCDRLEVDAESLEEVIRLVRSLEPRPGSRIGNSDAEYIAPDVYVIKRNGSWQVSLNPDCTPRLAINGYYSGLIKKASEEDASYLRGQLQEARWLIKSLETRNDTLLKVARCIVEFQRDFLDVGAVGMKPLVLRDIADAVEMHESTISRVTTRKYLHTPHGVFEFKYFFSSHVRTSDGGECSATAIRAMLSELIKNEPPGKPLSDSRLTKILNERGIDVARRTVAKYREALGVPSSTQRRRLI